MDIPTSIRLPNFNLDTRYNTVLIQEVWSGDDGNEWEDALTGGSNLEVFPEQSHARPVRMKAGGRKGMRKCDDCTIGKECQAGWVEDGSRESELERERGSTVVITVPCIQMVSPTHTNHNEHPRTSPIPLSNAKGTNTECDTGVFTRTHARTRARTDLSHVESRNGNMQLGRQASLRRLENSKDLPRDLADRCRTSKDLESRPSVITTPFVEKRHAIASLDMLPSRKQRLRYSLVVRSYKIR